jgi:hypothetical protein
VLPAVNASVRYETSVGYETITLLAFGVFFAYERYRFLERV